MAKWQLEFSEKALKELKDLEKSVANFIILGLKNFILHYDHAYEQELLKTQKIKKLKGSLDGFYRLRLRSFRVIYQKLDDRLVIYVLRVSDRKDAY
ncbi:type II toxin-antitoxin system RelE family toxin [Campylobacter mucosalis]|uniref:Toxin-antitoxin system, toxin component, RelE family n=1 Tax=Campylobacter mucosalis CCUG 21559 TaxID=1032067 RepID=A0A6G5QGI6_9BACT|nr:type II toxin-antitoxin system RelE/ParE family toxin [Campylobacter mucosalis]QCD44095.1 toxin-antitoxin system, toxin component, RelE family [Campylobacter mucosalis CCUG 21559]QCD44687.1 toxin-antitoxin system, toxin component, RelE family [Campylobacter mucosalis CCUG 21559]